jgi:hypothetical protein
VAATVCAAAVQLVISRSYCERVIAPLSSSAWARLHSSAASRSWAWAAPSWALTDCADSAALEASSRTSGSPNLTLAPRSTSTATTRPGTLAATSDDSSAATMPVSVRRSGAGPVSTVASPSWTGASGAGPLPCAADLDEQAAAAARDRARAMRDMEAPGRR